MDINRFLLYLRLRSEFYDCSFKVVCQAFFKRVNEPTESRKISLVRFSNIFKTSDLSFGTLKMFLLHSSNLKPRKKK